ncbi:hypothetical protein JS562_41030, partial [Agrobacterium sp. S2]|nr:hypothetical protein [Agrobacterium sp. S2]
IHRGALRNDEASGAICQGKKKQGLSALFSSFRVICNRYRGCERARLRSDPPKTDRENDKNLNFLPLL